MKDAQTGNARESPRISFQTLKEAYDNELLRNSWFRGKFSGVEWEVIGSTADLYFLLVWLVNAPSLTLHLVDALISCQIMSVQGQLLDITCITSEREER